MNPGSMGSCSCFKAMVAGQNGARGATRPTNEGRRGFLAPIGLRFLFFAMLAGAPKVNAQPITTIYSFGQGPATPLAGVTLGNDGSFYGTASAGGLYNGGIAFKITTNGAMTTLVNFNGYPSGSSPKANLTLAPDGSFYGTTALGGTNISGNNAAGTVFKMTTNGTETVLVNFNGANGGIPLAGLTLGPDGNYYGTSEFGGTQSQGTVFKMTTNGTLTTLVSFNGTNGAKPVAGLAVGPGGNLYGSTSSGGGTNIYGTVFAVTTNGTLATLFQFSGTNGWGPSAVTVGPDGNLYGTTALGGSLNGDMSAGSIFQLTTNGVLTTLVRLADFSGTNGSKPMAGLTLGPDGNFYGTTQGGGTNGTGTVFEVSTNGTLALLARIPGIQIQIISNSEGYEFYTTNNFQTIAPVYNGTITTLYNFSAQTNFINGDGAQPQSTVTFGPDGLIYGTASGGGTNGYGTVFKVTTNGAFSTLASFSGNNGYAPMDALTQGPSGSFYGTANSGGTLGYGTVFKLSANGAVTTLVNFDRAIDGANPQAGLIRGPGGNLYGTAVGGGSNLVYLGNNNYNAVSDGTVFELTTNGVFMTLADFNGTNGANPSGGLAVGPDGNFYGTATYGGISNEGTIFMLPTNGPLKALTNFTGANGANPFASLTLGPDGNFYGTCEGGGTNGKGTIFQVTTNGTLTTLVYFNGTNGANPNDGLLLGPDGNFYGTAYAGGANNGGTVFQMTPGGTLTILVSFAQTNGGLPVAGLALGPDGYFYGTTELGGASANAGTVFKVSTNGTLTTLYGFAYAQNSDNGNYPFATLALGTNGNFVHFYGSTYNGGSGGGGTIYRLNLITPYAVAENSTNTFYPLTNDVVWTIGGTLGLIGAQATNGTAQIAGAGITFTPAANFTGTATVNYNVTDNAGGTNYSLITVLVTNIPPVANPDFYTVAENSGTNVLSPLTNDVLGTSGGALSIVSASPTNGTASISGTNILFTPQANFTGTATIGYTITDNVGGTNSSLITVTVVNVSADLSLSAGAAPEPVGVGNNLVYSITVSNAGPATATGVVVSNQIPAGAAFVSATGGAAPSGGALLLNIGSLAPDATSAVQVVVQPTAAGRLTNVFQVYGSQNDPALGNNLATVVSTVTNASQVNLADLSLNVIVAPNPLDVVSTNLTYTITVSNAGPVTATGVTVSNQIFTAGSGMIFNSATGGATPTNGVLEMDLGWLAPGQTDQAQITAIVIRGTNTFATFYTNTFTVFGDQTDPIVSNNVASVTFEATNANAILSSTSSLAFSNNLTATATEQTTNFSTQLIAVMLGGTVVYNQTFADPFSNAAVQAGVTQAATDLTNAGATSYTGPTAVSAVQTPQNSSSVTATNLVGTNITTTVIEYVGPTNVFVGPNQSQPLHLYSGQTDYDTLTTSDVTNLVTTTVTSNFLNSAVYVMTGIVAQAVMSISATAAPEPVGVGSNLVYSVIVSNGTGLLTGVQTRTPVAGATDVTISNRIPAAATFVSTSVGAVPTNGLLLINLGTLPAGQTNGVQIVIRPETAGKLTNTFMVSADQADQVPGNNVATVISTITNPPPPTVDVAVSIVAAPNPVDVGSALTYSVTASNNSPTTATGVVVSDSLPPNVTFESALPSQGSATNKGSLVTYNVGALPSGAAATLAIVVIPNTAGILTNIAAISSGQTDSAPANNSATNITTAVAVPITNLTVTVLSGITLNRQTGLYEQQVEVFNGGPDTPPSVLLLVNGLTGAATLYNATGKTNGEPYVQSFGPLGVGSNIVFRLEYYSPTRTMPAHLAFTAEPGPPVNPPVITGTIMSISRTVILGDGRILVEFAAIPGRIYAIQYSSDLATWRTAVPVITAPANRVQWIDAGPPQTATSPDQTGVRYYRVVLLP